MVALEDNTLLIIDNENEDIKKRIQRNKINDTFYMFLVEDYNDIE